MPKGNPNPKLPKEFLESQFKRQDDSTAPMAAKNIQLRLTADIDEVIRKLPNRSGWLRKVITEAAKRELMDNDSKPAIADSLQSDKPTSKRKKGGDE